MTTPRLPRTPQELGAPQSELFFDAEKAVASAVQAGIANNAPAQNQYHGIPRPFGDVESVVRSVMALIEIVEGLVGARGDINASAIKVGDMPAMLESLRSVLHQQLVTGLADVVEDTIVDGEVDIAPSQNAVFDALAGKEPTITGTTSVDYYRGDKTFQNFASAAKSAAVADAITDGVTDIAPSQNAVFDALALADGQKLDATAPGNASYGWRDITSEVTVRGTGANSPTFSTFRNGISAYEFSPTTMKEFWMTFHIDHDYAMGTAIFPHVHFAVGNSANSGVVRWGIEYTIAKGHQQGADSVFGATNTVYVNMTVGANSNYEHHVAEYATGITSTLIEPDSLVLIRFFRDAANVNDTFPDSVWAFTGGLHYQFDRYGTINKSPDFYGT